MPLPNQLKKLDSEPYFHLLSIRRACPWFLSVGFFICLFVYLTETINKRWSSYFTLIWGRTEKERREVLWWAEYHLAYSCHRKPKCESFGLHFALQNWSGRTSMSTTPTLDILHWLSNQWLLVHIQGLSSRFSLEYNIIPIASAIQKVTAFSENILSYGTHHEMGVRRHALKV